MKRLFMVAVLVAALLPFSIDGYAQWGKTDLGNTYGSRRGGGYVGGTDRGFKITGEVGAMGISGLGMYGKEFNALVGCGYQFNPYFYLGGLIGSGYHGLGYDKQGWYGDTGFYSEGGVFIFTTDLRAYLLRRKVSPFFSARVGMEHYKCYGIAPYIGGGPGLRIMLGRKVGLTIHPAARLGYNMYCLLGGSVGVEF